jgi:hypothetical protein
MSDAKEQLSLTSAVGRDSADPVDSVYVLRDRSIIGDLLRRMGEETRSGSAVGSWPSSGTSGVVDLVLRLCSTALDQDDATLSGGSMFAEFGLRDDDLPAIPVASIDPLSASTGFEWRGDPTTSVRESVQASDVPLVFRSLGKTVHRAPSTIEYRLPATIAWRPSDGDRAERASATLAKRGAHFVERPSARGPRLLPAEYWIPRGDAIPFGPTATMTTSVAHLGHTPTHAEMLVRRDVYYRPKASGPVRMCATMLSIESEPISSTIAPVPAVAAPPKTCGRSAIEAISAAFDANRIGLERHFSEIAGVRGAVGIQLIESAACAIRALAMLIGDVKK